MSAGVYVGGTASCSGQQVAVMAPVPPALTVCQCSALPFNVHGVLGIATGSEDGKGAHCICSSHLWWGWQAHVLTERGSYRAVPASGNVKPRDLPMLLPKK